MLAEAPRRKTRRTDRSSTSTRADRRPTAGTRSLTPGTVNNSGSFAFGTPIASGAAYSVTVKTQPTLPRQTCVVDSGTVAGGDISNVSVTCTTNKYKIRGTVTGVTGGSITLKNNGGDDLVLNADGTFEFATSIVSGAVYAVSIGTLPAGKSCGVKNGSGTVGGAVSLGTSGAFGDQYAGCSHNPPELRFGDTSLECGGTNAGLSWTDTKGYTPTKSSSRSAWVGAAEPQATTTCT